MKILNQYWKDILSKKKTKEFRKVDFLDDINNNLLCHNDKNINKGIISDFIYDYESDEPLGKIYFNGYIILSKEEFWEKVKINQVADDFYGQVEWINNNKEFLENYYKKEKEILVLYIKKVNVYKNGKK